MAVARSGHMGHPPIKQPQQQRSRAAYERMIAAAERLMMVRGSESFTMQDVSETGEVSIGSIYLRFQSKDDLVRAVITKALARLALDETIMFDHLARGSPDLDAFIHGFVDDFAEVLKRHAPLLRLTMERAAHDQNVSLLGKKHARQAAARAVSAILSYREEILGDRHVTKATTVHGIVFSALARELGLGTTSESAHPQEWPTFKRELAVISLAYLHHAL